MFNRNPDSTYKEAIVLAVDIRRGVCKCRTRDGHFLTNVSWARPLGLSQENGDSYSPLPNEVVVITDVGGEPMILFSKTVLTANDSSVRARITPQLEGDTAIQDYNLSVLFGNSRMEGASPDNIVVGDRVITNDRGSVLGLLKSGSVLLKGGPLAQIFVTRLDDLVRVVSRNLELFSDSFTQVSANVKGKLYTFRGYFKSPTASRDELPEYYEVVGNVAVGLTGKGDPLSADTSATSDELKREVVTQYEDGVEGTPRFVHTLHEDGKSVRKSATSDDATSTIEELNNGVWRITVTDGTNTSVVEVTPGKVKVITTGDLEENVDGNVTRIIGGDLTETVTGNVTRSALNVTDTVTGTLLQTVTLNRTHLTGGNVSENATGSHVITGNPVVVP